MKYITNNFLIIIIVLLLGLFSSCSKGVEQVLKTSPVNENVIDIVSKKYSDSELLEISKYKGTINKLNDKYPVECLRKIGEYHRVAYLGTNSILIIYFDDNGNIISRNIYNSVLKKSDFDILKIGMSLEEVKKIDPNGDYSFIYTGRNDLKTSLHYTKDGYILSIEYDENNTIVNISESLI